MVEEKKYNYERFGTKGVRVGQAALDILSTDQPTYTAEDILDSLGSDWLNLIRDLADESSKEYGPKFYILSLLKKDLGQFGYDNVLKHSARPFKTSKSIKDVMNAHPNATKTLFEINSKTGDINLLWTVPGWQDCKALLKTPDSFDPNLVRWVKEAVEKCA